jgi:protocatechuate 3,4-dioxygenase beta subunit
VQYSYVRHVTGGQNASTCEDTNTYPVSVPTDPSSAALNSPASDASGNIYITPDSVEGGHAPYLQGTNSRCSETESGNDVFTVYIDKNGVPGFQTGDLLIGTETLPFGPESIYFKPCDQVTTYEDGNDPYANANYQTCDTQQKAGTDLTLTVFASIWDGTTRQPVTSRKIDITIPSGDNMTFSSSGNSGLTLVNSTEGDITTGAAGTATVTLSDPSPEGVDEVTASDPSLGDTITSDNAFDEVDWRNFNTSFNGTSAVTHHRYIGEITPLSEFSGTVGSPGQPLVEGFKVLDQNGDGIQDQPITLTTSAGFFTDTPDISGTDAGHNGPTYAALHFDGADATPADGAQIQGNLHSNGSTETVVTTHDGLVYFALGIKGDATGFAGDGEVTGDVTAQLDGAGATQVLPDNNGNNDAVNHASHQLLFSTSSFDHVASLNPASTNPLTLATGLFDNNGRYHITTVKPSGDKATTSTNTIPVDTVDTTAGQFDSFGNLVSEPIDVSTSGANGPDFPTRFYGAYAFVNNATADELDFSPNGDDDFFDCTSNEAAQSAGACPEIAGDDDVYVNQLTNPASNTPSTGAETVTMDWDANHTTWKTGVGGVSTNVLNAPDPTTSYTVNWYDREASGFKYLTSMSPKGGKHRAGTPITTTVLVLDSHNRPVNGLGVEFIRSGPKGQSQDTGNPFTCEGTCENIQFTNVSGQAGFTFSTSTPGKYKVTALITDGSGNEVGRAVSHGKLTKKHHKKKHHHHHKKHHHKKHHHKKKH